ncbi:hypothetical protein PFHG_01250 [Plasmodium falciparum HB3]|uniref:Uncharacterized protein n=1 Tax=Plasmodium falciparum (isolate HB3) TaxID=137071 RepID=A0A0L7K9B2_PLAFX|nr:hypothetical protein PFHG_01250 [Plasmodium falciparum HB3]
MDENIYNGTFIYLIIWLIITLVSLAVFCLWIFWLCVYISQLNPIVFPQRRTVKD